ncbi:MAG: FAD-binding protein, partial [Rhodoferax sp.]|nr:FAD-binding protein [Rhodoferax sp.]
MPPRAGEDAVTADWDVIIIGAGPTGLTGAHLLATMGVRTLVIEKNPTTVQQPRAVSIDDEALRTMQAAGLVDDVVAHVNLDYGFRILDPKGREVYKVSPSTREYGYPKRNAFVQPILEDTLRRTLARRPQASIRFETECVAIEELRDGVRVEVVDRQGQRQTLNCRYLIGTDGGRSFVRGVIGSTLQGSTYAARWLIVDLEGTRDRTRESCVYSDPARPAVNIPGPDGRRRFEFMLHPHEGDELAQDENYIRGLLAAYGPDRDARIVRRQVYTFHARVADRWQTDRIFLAGDAAHLTPPFAGQGVNSAFRDIHNITWKIAAVVHGEMGPRLLASYQAERA